MLCYSTIMLWLILCVEVSSAAVGEEEPTDAMACDAMHLAPTCMCEELVVEVLLTEASSIKTISAACAWTIPRIAQLGGICPMTCGGSLEPRREPKLKPKKKRARKHPIKTKSWTEFMDDVTLLSDSVSEDEPQTEEHQRASEPLATVAPVASSLPPPTTTATTTTTTSLPLRIDEDETSYYNDAHDVDFLKPPSRTSASATQQLQPHARAPKEVSDAPPLTQATSTTMATPRAIAKWTNAAVAVAVSSKPRKASPLPLHDEAARVAAHVEELREQKQTLLHELAQLAAMRPKASHAAVRRAPPPPPPPPPPPLRKKTKTKTKTKTKKLRGYREPLPTAALHSALAAELKEARLPMVPANRQWISMVETAPPASASTKWPVEKKKKKKKKKEEKKTMKTTTTKKTKTKTKLARSPTRNGATPGEKFHFDEPDDFDVKSESDITIAKQHAETWANAVIKRQAMPTATGVTIKSVVDGRLSVFPTKKKPQNMKSTDFFRFRPTKHGNGFLITRSRMGFALVVLVVAFFGFGYAGARWEENHEAEERARGGSTGGEEWLKSARWRKPTNVLVVAVRFWGQHVPILAAKIATRLARGVKSFRRRFKKKKKKKRKGKNKKKKKKKKATKARPLSSETSEMEETGDVTLLGDRMAKRNLVEAIDGIPSSQPRIEGMSSVAATFVSSEEDESYEKMSAPDDPSSFWARSRRETARNRSDFDSSSST